MKILYLGAKKRRSLNEYLVLKKIHKNVDLIDPFKSLPFRNISIKIFHHISPKIFIPLIDSYILSKIKKSYDLIIVRQGEFIGKSLILKLKKKTNKIIFICMDNPFTSRDKQRFKLCLPALKYYDLIIFQQSSRIRLSKKYGVKKSLLIIPDYIKKKHCLHKITAYQKKKYNNDVVFIGTWMPERGLFFKKLIEMGLNLKIYGSHWQKDKNYEFLSSRIKLGQVHGKLYSKIIQCSKIALSIPSKGNLDDISNRSLEIPASGTLLCASETKIHKKLFIENKEAVFFKNEKECHRKCKDLLQNANKLKKIARRGYIKVTKILKVDTESQIKKIVSKVFQVE